MDTDQQQAAYLRALEAEREGYERSGRTDRAAAVDAEIARVRGDGERVETRLRGAARKTRAAKPEDAS